MISHPLQARQSFATRAVLICALAIFACATLSRAGTLDGVVHNGTTGKPGANLDVILIQLQGGMQPIATVKTDAAGHFHMDSTALGGAPMLIRVPYHGVNYHQPVPPGTATADVQIYEPTQDAKSFSVTTHALVLQPNNGQLLVGEEYDIENHTNPPVAFFKESGTFEFHLPQGAQMNQVSAWGSGGMPVVQATIDRPGGAQAIAFPFRPGNNGVRISYQMPYPGNQAVIHSVAPYDAKRVVVVAPPTLTILAPGFSPAGTEQGFNLYSHDDVAGGKALDVSVSGTAPMPSANSDSQDAQQQQNPSAEQGTPESDRVMPQVMPGRIDNIKWFLIAGFAALFALGLVLLWKRPQVPAPVAVAAAGPAFLPVFAEAERAVKGSLDEIKDRLFRIELRRQAGTITEADYARQRAEAEKVLRDLLKD